jgi:hypothetical protein
MHLLRWQLLCCSSSSEVGGRQSSGSRLTLGVLEVWVAPTEAA